MSLSARGALLGLIFTSVSLNAAAQILLWSGARSGVVLAGRGPGEIILNAMSRPGILGGLVCYGLGAVLWVSVLTRAEASLAYPFLGLGFAMVAVAGHVFLGEELTGRRIAAIGIIGCGIVLLAGS